MCSRSVGLIVEALSLQVDRRLSRRLPVGRRRLDLHLERHPALPDEGPEERVDGGGHGQAELVQDGRGLPLDLRVDADRRGGYVRRHGSTPPRISRCDHSTVSMRRARPRSPCRAVPRRTLDYQLHL